MYVWALCVCIVCVHSVCVCTYTVYVCTVLCACTGSDPGGVHACPCFYSPSLVENEDFFPCCRYRFLTFSFLRCVTPFRTTTRISPMETLYIPPGCHGEPGSETTDRKLWRQDGANDTPFIYTLGPENSCSNMTMYYTRASFSNRGELPLVSQLLPLHTCPRLSRPMQSLGL